MAIIEYMTPVVLAGGSGTRLWPLSTPDIPKQFAIKTASGLSLFQETLQRVAHRGMFLPPLVVTHHRYEALLVSELHAIDCQHAAVIYEPQARNTAAAIMLAACKLSAQDPHALMLVLPSDHHIDAPEEWMAVLPEALAAAQQGHIVTFAITPTAPETGYGYIEKGALLDGHAAVHGIARFVEKPDVATAAAFIAQGGYGWNSGMFLMRASTVIEEIRLHAPELEAACLQAFAHARHEGNGCYPQALALEHCPSIAFDRAVMEHTKRGAVIAVAMGWRDLGSWEALAAHAAHLKTPASELKATHSGE